MTSHIHSAVTPTAVGLVQDGLVGDAMSKPEFFTTPGYGKRQLEIFHYSQAVKVGNRVETSGQGGWDDEWQFPETLADEIAQAFRNVERTLASAGAGWKHVIAVNSYHLGFPDEVNQIMTEQFRTHMPNHAPIWTALGVAALGDPKMRVEIRATAILPE
jgi:enamine deaminase RidA (YjgF/YER057c/UK114 family)